MPYLPTIFRAGYGLIDSACCSYASRKPLRFSVLHVLTSFEMAYGKQDAPQPVVGHKKDRIDMKSKWLLGFAVASALSAPAFGQVQIYIGAPPPPIRYEAPPPPPSEVGFVWTAGFWE